MKINTGKPKSSFKGLKMKKNRKRASIKLFTWNPSENGLEVVDVEYSKDQSDWRMLRKRELSSSAGSSKRSQCTHFSVKGSFALKSRIDFRLMLKESTENYSFCLVDRLHGDQLWSAATDRRFTDVEFAVDDKSFYAHRAILAARSPHFAKMFGTGEKLAKYEIASCDPCAFKQLLLFVYTGGLQATVDNKDLLLAARENGIATLQSVCERALETSFHSIADEDFLRMSLLMKSPA